MPLLCEGGGGCPTGRKTNHGTHPWIVQGYDTARPTSLVLSLDGCPPGQTNRCGPPDRSPSFPTTKQRANKSTDRPRRRFRYPVIPARSMAITSMAVSSMNLALLVGSISSPPSVLSPLPRQCPPYQAQRSSQRRRHEKDVRRCSSKGLETVGNVEQATYPCRRCFAIHDRQSAGRHQLRKRSRCLLPCGRSVLFGPALEPRH